MQGSLEEEDKLTVNFTKHSKGLELLSNREFNDEHAGEELLEEKSMVKVMPTPNQMMSRNCDGDDSDDIWEDEASYYDINDISSSSVALNMEWEWRHNQFHTIGYREGITAGKDASAQEGFNDGYNESVYAGYSWGLVRGISSAVSSLPDQLREKLTSIPQNKDRFQSLYESTRDISSNDALQIFYSSKQQHGKGNSSTLIGEDSCNQLESYFNDLSHLLHDSSEINVDLGHLKDSTVGH